MGPIERVAPLNITIMIVPLMKAIFMSVSGFIISIVIHIVVLNNIIG